MDMQSMLQKMKQRADAQKSKPSKRPDRMIRSGLESESMAEKTALEANSEVNSLNANVKIGKVTTDRCLSEPSSNQVQNFDSTLAEDRHKSNHEFLNQVQTRFVNDIELDSVNIDQTINSKIDLNDQGLSVASDYLPGCNDMPKISENTEVIEPGSNQVQPFKNELAPESESESINLLNQVQTGFKPGSESKTSTNGRNKINFVEPSSNQVQQKLNSKIHKSRTPFKPGLNQVQSKITATMNAETQFEPGSEPSLDQVQSGFKVGAQPGSKISLFKLSPLQISILKYFHYLTEIERSEITPPIKINDITSACNTNNDGAKTAIKRMLKSNVIERVDYKDGRGGWCQYRIPESTHSQILLELKPSVNQVQSGFKVGSEPGSEPGSNPPSKLVSNFNNNLLTSDSKPIANSPFDVSAINLNFIAKYGISRKQIQDIFNQKLEFNTDALQNFVDRFAIYVSDPNNIKGVKSIPAVFVRMAQLASKGQDPLIEIETDTDRLIRERLERLKALKEERLKQKQELLDLEFENWLEEIDLDQVEKIAPATSMMKQGSVAQKMTLKNYFIENVWSQKTGNLFFNQQEI